MEKVKVSFEDSAFIVEVEGKKLRVSYKQAELPFKEAQEFCKENGGNRHLGDGGLGSADGRAYRGGDLV